MKNARIAIVALAVLGGCAELPTDSKAGPPEVGGPSFDGGLVFGSGNRSQTDSTQTQTSSTTSTDSTGRGGLVFGSGN
jgi:hypothetical protein